MNFFFHFFVENELFTENVKKRVHRHEQNGWAVQPKQLVLISVEAEFYALQNNREFFLNFILVFELYIFCFRKYISAL